MGQRRAPASSTSPSTPAPAPASADNNNNKSKAGTMTSESRSSDDEHRHLLDHEGASEFQDTDDTPGKMGWARNNQWIVLAIASGACAAFNGMFAKLTTTELTTGFAQGIARVFHLDAIENAVEYIVRAIFFGLNLIFNGVMWTLFTQALARGHSTTQVSIMNTSSNFVLTAMLGLMIFSESLPPLWWVGATLLIIGNVVIGSKDESGQPGGEETDAVPAPGEDGLGAYEDVPQRDGVVNPKDDEDVVELGDLDE